MDSILDTIAQVATRMNLPALLLKAFMAVEGGSVTHRDGLLQVIPGTRVGVIRRMDRAHKLAALGLQPADPVADDALNAQFAQAYQNGNSLVQLLCGGQYINEQLAAFGGYVTLAALAYNAGPNKAKQVIAAFGSSRLATAKQYHKRLGPGADQATAQPGIDSVDGATGQHWLRIPVLANDSGKEMFQYLYMRQVPGRNAGLLDYIFNPSLLAPRGFFQNDHQPGPDSDTTVSTVLTVDNGQFKLVPANSPPAKPPVGSGADIRFNTKAFSQRDPQWRSRRLGFSSSLTIGSDGCTLTALTMMANGLGFNETPASLNEKLKALGPGKGFIGPRMVFGGITQALPGIHLNYYINRRASGAQAPLDEIDKALDKGLPVVVEVDRALGAGIQNHWVLIVGKQQNDYVMLDPWTVPAAGPELLGARYSFGRPISRTIRFMIFYSGAPGAPADPPPTSAVYAVVNDDPDIRTANGLALRDGPHANANPVARLPAGTKIEILDTYADFSAKLGFPGQWLNAKTNDAKGYVAAWLVQSSAVVQAAAAQVAADPSQSEASDSQDGDGPVQSPLREEPARLIVSDVEARTRGRGASASLRASPFNGRRLSSLAIGTPLYPAEHQDSVLRKLGQSGEWVKVCDPQGNIGYVSAAFIHQESDLSDPVAVPVG